MRLFGVEEGEAVAGAAVLLVLYHIMLAISSLVELSVEYAMPAAVEFIGGSIDWKT